MLALRLATPVISIPAQPVRRDVLAGEAEPGQVGQSLLDDLVDLLAGDGERVLGPHQVGDLLGRPPAAVRRTHWV